MSDRPSAATERVPTRPPDAPSTRAFPDLGRFWTWANVLTLSRVALVAPIALLVYRDGPLLWLIALILLAVATDYFDGKVARWTGTVSEWGKVLDPLADKLAAGAVVLALVLRPVEPNLPLWFLLLVILRDVTIAGGGIVQTRRVGMVLMALWSGKFAVNLLALLVIAALLRSPQIAIDLLLWATAVVLVISWFEYLYRFVQVMRLGEDVRLDERHRVVRTGPSDDAPPPRI